MKHLNDEELEEKKEEKFDSNFDETKAILKKVPFQLASEYIQWTNEKANMKFFKRMPSFPITNNFIYWCNLGINIGSEQNKIRPVVIVRNQAKSPICTVLPLTSVRLNDKKWYHIDLKSGNSTAMIEQLKNISKLRILNPKRTNGKVDRIEEEDLKNINEVLQKYYKLQEFPKNKKGEINKNVDFRI